MKEIENRIKDKFIRIEPDLKLAKKRTSDNPEILRESIEIPMQINGIGKNKTYCIQTFGCQMNAHDTEVMAGILEILEFTSTDNMQEADIVILNTCAIRENAESKVFGKIGSLKHLKTTNPDKIFAVCGCMAQEESVVNRILEKYQHIDLIFGTHNIHRLPFLIDEAYKSKEMVVEVWSQEGDIVEDLPKVRDNNTKAWVNIIYGCDKFCTYCIVPFTRGKERSRLPQDIIDEVKKLKIDGYKELTLLGQNVNAYGKDLNINYRMADLLEDIAQIGIERIRFTTSHPWDFEEELIDVIAKYDNIMSHVHLPVQSGNDQILKIMGRSYTREKYLKLFDQIKKKIPGVVFTTDIIVGYPNETEEQFEDTLSLYEYCKYDTAYTFVYSPREGTPAAVMEDNISLEIKKARLQKLNKLVNHYAQVNNDHIIGQVVNVLVDGPSKKNQLVYAGYSEGLKLVHFESTKELTGQIVQVKINDAKSFSLYGDLIN